MRIKLIILFISSFLTLNLWAQYSRFEKFEDKTWFENNDFAGITVVFYQTANGLHKAIRQINGSGVPVVASAIYDLEISQDTVYLINGLNLKTGEKVEDYCYCIDSIAGQIFSNKELLKKICNEAILYAWIDKKINTNTLISLKKLKKLPLLRNEIYKKEDLVAIFEKQKKF